VEEKVMKRVILGMLVEVRT